MSSLQQVTLTDEERDSLKKAAKAPAAARAKSAQTPKS